MFTSFPSCTKNTSSSHLVAKNKLAVFTKHNVDNDDDDVTTKEKEADITEPLKYWRTTAGGLRMVDDKIVLSGEKPVNGDVVRVQ